MRYAIAFGPLADITAPRFLSANTGSVSENGTLSKTISTDEICTFAIVGGFDDTAFELASAGPAFSVTLRWASNGTQDFETPVDANTDNDYEVTVEATDLSGNTTQQSITITVINVTGEGEAGQPLGPWLWILKAS